MLKGGVLPGVTINSQKQEEHPVQGLPALSNVCIAVLREAEKVEEEWSPHSVNVVVFHSH